NGVDDSTAVADVEVVMRSGGIDVRWRAGILARQVGADRLPVLATVARAEETLVAEVQRLRVSLGERERHRPDGAVVILRVREHRIDVADLAGLPVEFVDARAAVRGIAGNDVRIIGIGRDHAALAADRDLAELLHGNAVTACGAARERGGARVLLSAIHPVGELVVRDDVIDLRGRLVVPAAPGLAAVERDLCALVAAEDAPLTVRRVDPQGVEVVSRLIALERDEMRAAVLRLEHDGVHDPDPIGIRRIGGQRAEIPTASPDPRVRRDVLPQLAAIVGAVEASLTPGTIGQGVDALWIGGGDREADAAGIGREAVAVDVAPVIATAS